MGLRLRTIAVLVAAVLVAGACGPRFKEAKGGATGQVAAGDNGAGSGSAAGGETAAGSATGSATASSLAAGSAGPAAVGPGGPATTTGAPGGADIGPTPGVTDTTIKIGYL